MTKQKTPKQTRSRKDEDKAQRREDIIDAAEIAFFNTDFGKVSMASIAKSAGVSRALIYVYFEDQADVYRAIMVRASSDLKQRFVDAYHSETSGYKKIKAIGLSYYQFYLEKTNYFNMLTDSGSIIRNMPKTPSEKEKKTIKLLTQTSGECMEIMSKALSEGVKDGSVCKVRAENPTKAAYFLRGMLHGVMLSGRIDNKVIDRHCDFTVEELIEYSIENACIALSNEHNIDKI